jgi:type I restriction enzyme M protein
VFRLHSNDIDVDDIEEEVLLELIQSENKGYNSYIFKEKKQLKDICRNDTTFYEDFNEYLDAFDEETKTLLGVNKTNKKVNYLNIIGQSATLEDKKILKDFTTAWSKIDLQPFNNSEITTLEEHIKRKWADLSADTAGEQYTPDDIIALIAEIIASKPMDKEKIVTIYDPTCGGGNLLYGVEDRVRENFTVQPATYGQDFNQVLYALAKIESRFRGDNSYIDYGNTLIDDKFRAMRFDYVVANPPYGIPWKTFSSDIYKDETERFDFYPSVSDGQMLFLQHINAKINDEGMGVVVLNGSSLFSGDAGSGESNIRMKLLDSDIVEAIIQLPTDEFFNTGIFTYIWVLNKKKKHKNKLMLINASEKFVPLKKNKGSKRKEIDAKSRIDIVKTLSAYKDNDYAKVFDREFFYFNKQALMLTNLDYRDKYIKDTLKLTPIKVIQDDICITQFDKIYHLTLSDVKETIKQLDYKESDLKVYVDEDSYYFYDEDKETIVKQDGEKQEELGCGKVVIKTVHKKATKKTKNKEAIKAHIKISVEISSQIQKDYEIIPHTKDEKRNQKNINNFMKKYVSKPFVLLDNVVGVEVNFNKIFYKPQKLRPLEHIVADLESIDEQLQELEKEFSL